MNRTAWHYWTAGIIFVGALSILSGCAAVPLKQYYLLNYIPSARKDRLNPAPYPCTIRLRDFDIEEAYNRPEIVYRQSPFQLQYDYYRAWAVKPARMISDLVYKHLFATGIVSSVIRRFDEGPKPNYELSGMIEALDEYDSQELWFAHIALRINLIMISDGTVMYTKRFDLRKRVFEHKPENVIRELSSLMEFIMVQTIHDIDAKLAKEYGLATPAADTSGASPVTGEIK
jgi:ABC-type uncharacterized transport system auxiliary subunit